MTKGKLIVLYGINNLGKTTQAEKLVERLNSHGINSKYLKYGVYGLEPSGVLLNEYVRLVDPNKKRNPHEFTVREFQILQVLNRWQYQPTLLETLAQGITVVAEDYVGTGIAWGIANGVDEQLMKYFAIGLRKEDLAFVFTGKRFNTGRESNHVHETRDDLTEKCAQVHLKLADEYGWIRVNANRPVPEISDEIFDRVISLYYTSQEI